MSMLVFVFGDSIAWGLYDDRGGWVGRLWNARSRLVYNLGVDGETSEDISKRFIAEAKVRGANKNSIIVFAVGVNDSSRMNGSQGELSRIREQYGRNDRPGRGTFHKENSLCWSRPNR